MPPSLTPNSEGFYRKNNNIKDIATNMWNPTQLFNKQMCIVCLYILSTNCALLGMAMVTWHVFPVPLLKRSLENKIILSSVF